MEAETPKTMRVRTAGFVMPRHGITFSIDCHARCGGISDGVAAYFDGDRYGGVMDFDDLCAVVDAVRAIRAHAAEQELGHAIEVADFWHDKEKEARDECDRLRAENETLRKRAVECMPMLETLREALGTDLGSGGGFVSVLDGIDCLRAQRDALVAVLQSGQSLRTHDLNTTERWVIDDVDEVREAIRAAKDNQ